MNDVSIESRDEDGDKYGGGNKSGIKHGLGNYYYKERWYGACDIYSEW